MDSLSLIEILFILKKGLKWIITSVIIFALIMGAISLYIMPEKYSSQVSIYITSTTKTTDITTQANLNTAQEMATTYIKILTKDLVLEEAVGKLDSRVTVGQLRSALSITSDGDTQILIISALTKDPQLSADICNTMATVAQSFFARIFDSGSVEQLDTATPSSLPSSPNIKRNVVLGAFVGALFSGAILIIVHLLDNTVKGEEDLKSHLNIPVLGEIPSFDNSKKKRRSGRA